MMKKYPNSRQEILADGTTTESENQGTKPDDTFGQTSADLKEQLKLQKLISDISAIFVNLPAGKVDNAIENGLKSIVTFMGIDRCTMAEFSEDRKDLYELDQTAHHLPLYLCTNKRPETQHNGLSHRGGGR